ncbi:class GN sortase [Pseudomarimonas salicorniae]|uniref:Class GN sortase n=1 Tax=Pseudomarimonas salicorniae TaxID=2933270 RepID=A0ABT0GIU8_9GAMM|nr:class GN sortase [Lysobacter sp. CAU 1642]MCK7593925.1 class GN sortase [Lysobacter sp. CAU 1642]
MNPVSALRRGVIGLLLTSALALAVDAGWIHAKAALSQVLLRQAWLESRLDGATHRPWPWADTHPVALLRVTELEVEQVVLAGDSGRVLAFGPGWAPASASPEGGGTIVISGHRDTHFAWLRSLVRGDRVELETTQGLRTWQVSEMRVADSRRERIALDADRGELLLVTCWPFDAVRAGGPMRYVVRLIET